MKKQFSPEPIEFNAQWHTYRPASGVKLLSVSGFLKHYSPVFDSVGNSERVALKRGITAQEVLAEWEAKAENSRQKGTEFHAKMEEYFLNREKFGRLESADPVVQKVLEQIPTLKLSDGDLQFHSEALIAWPAWGLAGTSDLVVYSPKRNLALLYDFKTNAEIKKEGFGGEKLLHPFQMLENCDYDKYELQLTLYGAMLMQQGIKIGGLAVIHIDHDGNVVKYPYPPDRFDFINGLDMQKRVKMAVEKTWDFPKDYEYQKLEAEYQQKQLPDDLIKNFISKAARADFVQMFRVAVEEGNIDALEAYLSADVLEKLAEEMKKPIKAKAIDRAESYHKGDRSVRGVKFNLTGSVTCTYKHDGEWLSLKAAEEQIKIKREAREEQMKHAAVLAETGQVAIDPETGEKIPPAEIKHSTKITFQYP